MGHRLSHQPSFQSFFKPNFLHLGLLNWKSLQVSFVMYCDASHIGLGCVLIKHGKVIIQAARQLKVHEKNYPTHDHELLAVVFALKIMRHYLHRVYVDIFTYHKSLQYVLRQRDLNLSPKRWLELLKDYDMCMLYNLDKVILWLIH